MRSVPSGGSFHARANEPTRSPLAPSFSICLRDVLADPSGRSIDGTTPHRVAPTAIPFASIVSPGPSGSSATRRRSVSGTSLIRFATEIQAKIANRSHKTGHYCRVRTRFDARFSQGTARDLGRANLHFKRNRAGFRFFRFMLNGGHRDRLAATTRTMAPRSV